MKKIKFLFISLVIVLSLNSLATVLYAEENSTNANTESDKEQKEEILDLINEYISTISTNLKDIDKKIENVKEQEEFAYYPAIRLNVDTPMFGMTSLVENRLRVKNDISTSDVASKYSIRDIAKNKIIRLPDSLLGSIVMSTKQYNIDTKMTLPQLKLALIKCIQYLSQVNSADDFIDVQINNIFKDYISDSKKAGINEVKNRNSSISNSLVDISNNINLLAFMGVDVTDYKNEYEKISKNLYSTTNRVKNTLMLEDEMNTLKKDSLSNESEVIDLQQKVKKAYEENVAKVDYGTFLQNVYNDFEKRTKRMDDYIKSATHEEEKDKVKVTVKDYDVTSLATLDYMKIQLDDLNTNIKEYNKKLEEDEKQDTENVEDNKDKTKEELEEEKTKKIEENKKKIEDIYAKYKEVLSREHRFYTSNINMLLKDSNNKISSIIDEIDSGIKISNNIFNYTKYIYLELPENLNTYMDENNLNSMLEKDNLITQLRKELKELCNVNIKVTKMYDKLSESLVS